jgi:ABC-2 type transport system ATP-binding protein
VRVESPDAVRLAEQLRNVGGTVSNDDRSPDALDVQGLTGREIGTLAARAGITLWELSAQVGSLEDAYLALTRDSLDFQDPAGTTVPDPSRTPTSSEELAR